MSATEPINVRDMAIVHRLFRQAYDESAQLVRAAPTPSPGRVTFLADHIDLTLEALHNHHEDEDTLLYPKLIERAPEQAQMTGHVEHEHQVITTALDALDGEERAYMPKTVPAPMRMLLPLMVERPWKKYAATLRNGT
jgi:Hemerythrin HHE cation binding domain